VRKVTHAQKRYAFWGLSVVGGQILGFSIDSRCRPNNTLALPCECVIKGYRNWYQSEAHM